MLKLLNRVPALILPAAPGDAFSLAGPDWLGAPLVERMLGETEHSADHRDRYAVVGELPTRLVDLLDESDHVAESVELVLWLEEHENLAPHEIAKALERRSGLAALAGTPDMREVEKRTDPDARLALDV
jgi:hypothetical protein